MDWTSVFCDEFAARFGLQLPPGSSSPRDPCFSAWHRSRGSPGRWCVLLKAVTGALFVRVDS